MRDGTRRNGNRFEPDDERASTDAPSRGHILLAFSFVLVLVLTGVIFVATGQAYLAYEQSGSVTATVTDVSVADGDGIVQVRVAVHNPTAVAVDIVAPAGITGRIDGRIVARAHATLFTERTVPAGGNRTIDVPLRIHHQSGETTVAAALDSDTFDLSGRLRGAIHDRSISITIERGDQ